MTRKVNRFNSTHEPLVSRVVVGSDERDTMMSVLCRNKTAYEKAVAYVQPERHFANDPVLQVLWESIANSVDVASGDMPAQTQLMDAISAAQDARPDIITDADVGRLNDLLEFAYDERTWGDYPVNSAYWTKVATSTLYRYLEEQTAQEVRDRVKTRTAVPSDLPTFMDSFKDDMARLKGLKGNTVNHRLEDGTDSWKQLVQLDFSPVGIPFFDKFLGNGQVAGEVYGFLGPYGSCKTTVSVMLAAEAARANYRDYRKAISELGSHEEDEPRPKMSFLITYEDGKRELLQRVLGYVAQVPRDTMENTAFLDMSTSDNLRDYEKKMFKSEIANGEPYMGEQERLDHAMGWLNNHLCIIDMTEEGFGSGGVREIAMIIEQLLHETSSDCGSVIIDYAGMLVKRMMMAGTVTGSFDDASMLRHHLSGVPGAVKSQIADKFNCVAWVMHQLSGAANARGPAAKLDHTDAAEARNFAENLNFCFVVGKPTSDNLLVMSCTKHRRRPPRDSIIVRVDGGMNQVIDADNHYVLVKNRNQIVSRDDFDRVAGPSQSSPIQGVVPPGSGGFNDDDPDSVPTPSVLPPPEDDDEFHDDDE